MTIYYSFGDDEEEKELKNILLTEAKLHFGHKFNISLYRSIWYKIKIPNSLFVRDLNDAKDKLYSGGSHFTLIDFMSCVEENLSFVPKVEIDDE